MTEKKKTPLQIYQDAKRAERAAAAAKAAEIEKARAQADAKRRAEIEARLPKMEEPSPRELALAEEIKSLHLLHHEWSSVGGHDPELVRVLEPLEMLARVLARGREQRWRNAVRKAEEAMRPITIAMRARLESADDVMVVLGRDYRGHGVATMQGTDGGRDTHYVAPSGVRIVFAARSEWDGGLSEAFEAERTAHLDRLRGVNTSFGFTPPSDEQLTQRADLEVGFALTGDERWDLPAIVQRYGLADIPSAPSGSRHLMYRQILDATICRRLLVRWAAEANRRGLDIVALTNRLADERRAEVTLVHGTDHGQQGPSVEGAVAFWQAVAQREEAARLESTSTKEDAASAA